MKCNEAIEMLDAYTDGLLADEVKAELDLHLKECSACKMEYAELKDMTDAFRSVSMVTVPSDFTYRIIERINKYSSNRIADWFDFIFTPRVLRWNVAVVFLLVAAAGSGLFFLPRARFSQGEVVNVKFEIELPEQNNIRTISLAGDFNGWNTKSLMLNPVDNNKWIIDVPLKRGRYQYMFVIDGKEWMPDPGAKKHISDGFGGKNSLLEL